MKKQLLSLMLAAAGLVAANTAQAQVTRQKVGTNPTTIDSSAALDVESTTRGFLAPRMTTPQRNAISGPAKGLQVFNTTTNQLEVNAGTPAAPNWLAVASSSPTSTATSKAQVVMNTSFTTMTYSTTDSLSWTSVIRIMHAGRGAQFAPLGYFDIAQPPAGTVIPAFGGAAGTTAGAGGIQMTTDRALYYALPIGGAVTADSFRVVGYQSDFVVPDHWILIAQRIGNQTVLRIGNGQFLERGNTWYANRGNATTYNTVPFSASELNLVSSVPADTNTGSEPGVATWTRPTTPGVKWGETVQWRLGTFNQGNIASQTRLLLTMGNGSTNGVDQTPFTVQSNGKVAIGDAAARNLYGNLDISNYGDSVGVLIRNGQYAVGQKAATTQISFGAGGSTTMRHSISTSYNPYVQMRYNAMRFNIWTTATPANNNPELTPFIVHGDAGGRIETISKNGSGGMWLDSGCYDCPGNFQKVFVGQERSIVAGPAGSPNRHAFGTYVNANGVGWNAFGVYDNGQVAIGTTAPNPSAQLDLASGNRGFLPPRMNNSQRNAIQFPADGLVIYSTDERCLNVYQAGTGWYNMCTNTVSAPVAVFASGSQSCSGTLAGTYAAAFNMNGSNTKQVSITVNTAGSYNVSTNTVNGVVFQASGTNIGTGAQTITLTASGNPTAAGTFNYVVTFASGITCQFSVTYVDDATYTAGTQNCGGTLAGSYNQGNATNGSNTKTVSITVATAGSYSITTDVQNGVSFSGQGVFTSTGAQSIVLTASGTPTAAGTFTYTVPFTTTGINCTFNVTYNPSVSAVTINCAGATISTSLGGNAGAIKFVNGTAYSGTITIPYSGGNSTSYAAESQTYNGLTFSRAAGSFSSSTGNIVYNVSGTYNGVTGAQFIARLYPGATYCDYRMGDAIRGALTASASSYDAAAVNSWVNISAAEYTQLRTSVRGIATGGASDADLANTSASTTTGANVTVGGSSTHADISGTYIVAFAVMPGAGGQSTSGIRVKHSNAVNSNYQYYGAALPAVTSTANTPLYFVIKKPNAGSYNILGAYTPSTFSIRTFGTANYNTGTGDITNPSTTVSNGTLQMQAMTTSEYQW